MLTGDAGGLQVRQYAAQAPSYGLLVIHLSEPDGELGAETQAGALLAVHDRGALRFQLRVVGSRRHDEGRLPFREEPCRTRRAVARRIRHPAGHVGTQSASYRDINPPSAWAARAAIRPARIRRRWDGWTATRSGRADTHGGWAGD